MPIKKKLTFNMDKHEEENLKFLEIIKGARRREMKK